MISKVIKSGYAFSRNPIPVYAEAPEGVTPGASGGSFSVSMGTEKIYTGRFYPPLDLDLAEIVDAHVEFFKEPEADNTVPVVRIETAAEMYKRYVFALFEFAEDEYEEEFEFMAIPGGISRQNLKRMLATDQDIFNARFFNRKSNFLMTTRTAGWYIVMKETELYPLYFILPGSATLEIVETLSKKSLSLGDLTEGVFALDLEAVRRKFMQTHDIIPNMFDLYVDGDYSCRLVIEASDASKERYRLKFRNSLGVFEIMELTGELSITPDYTKSDEADFARYDPDTGAFYADRERIERQQTITADTGVKRPDEVRFLMDMIGSEEVYLLDLTEFPLKVIPSVENLKYSPRPETPERWTLKLKIADAETNIMQEIIDGTEGRKPRVFSKQFSKQFN